MGQATTLTAPVLRGAMEIPVASSDGFAVGDNITISAGSCERNCERNSIASFGPIVLARPTKYEYPAGATIALAKEEDQSVECTCELLQVIGLSLDSTQHGKMLSSQFFHRLMEMQKEVDPATGKAVISRRVCEQISDLCKLRDRHWQR